MSIFGKSIFSHKCEENTIQKTLELAHEQNVDLIDANLSDTYLQGAFLCHQNLSGASLHNSNLKGANLYNANLKGADLGYIKLDGSDLRHANLSGSDLFGSELSGAKLSEANLSGADLGWSELSGANLSGANLSGADLRYTNLSGANLSGANLSGADLRYTNLSYTNLSGANLSGAILSEDNVWLLLAKQNIIYILTFLSDQVEGLKKKIIQGKIGGTQYEGDCCCLVGSIGGDCACQGIPFYTKGLHNLGEQLFYQIKEGDTPENNLFSKVALECCEFVLNLNK